MYNLTDKAVQWLIDDEYVRQQNWLEMIASENYVSKDVMMAYSNVFTNKYSEWYPRARYYGWQYNVDKLEMLTQYRGLKIFWLIDYEFDDTDSSDSNYDILDEKLKINSWWVNVQPYSGSPANLATCLRTIEPWSTILWMSLDAWWHLTHWHKVSASWIYYNSIQYGVRQEDMLIDYDLIRQLAIEHKPAMIMAWFSAYPRIIDWSKFRQIVDEVESAHGYRPILFADIAHIAGLIAWWCLEWPFEYFDIVTTTTHKTLRWPRGGMIYVKKGKLKRNWEEKDLEKLINSWVFPWLQWGPHEHVIASKCVAFGEILSQDYKIYTEKVIKNAQLLAQELISKGWRILTWWTDNHIVLIDVTFRNGKATWIAWKEAEDLLEEVGISVNKNKIPFDPGSAKRPSGLRVGTPAITSRWLGLEEIKIIADVIDMVLNNHSDKDVINKCRNRILNICKEFPLNY